MNKTIIISMLVFLLAVSCEKEDYNDPVVIECIFTKHSVEGPFDSTSMTSEEAEKVEAILAKGVLSATYSRSDHHKLTENDRRLCLETMDMVLDIHAEYEQGFPFEYFVIFLQAEPIE